jgi:hypothetical protein
MQGIGSEYSKLILLCVHVKILTHTRSSSDGSTIEERCRRCDQHRCAEEKGSRSHLKVVAETEEAAVLSFSSKIG